MYLPRYQLLASEDRHQFRFNSIGVKGTILKVIEFTYVDSLAFWNLGFGDVDTTTGRLDDQVVSDNGDGRKVLATVAYALQQFLVMHPDAIVFFAGSTEQRTRVYGWALNAYWSEINANFTVNVITEAGDVVDFPSEAEALGFLIRLKR